MFKFLLFFFLLSLSSSVTVDLNLSKDNSVDFYLISSKTHKEVKLNMLVDPMSTLIIIFENKIPPNTVNPITKTGLHVSYNNTYGYFNGELGVETFRLGNLTVRMRASFVTDMSKSMLEDVYDGILGVGFNRITDYSIFKSTNVIKPYLLYNKHERILHIGYTPKYLNDNKDNVTMLKMENGRNKMDYSLYIKADGIVINEITAVKDINEFPIGFDFYNKDLIISPMKYKDTLHKNYFPMTTQDEHKDTVFIDESNESNYINYFYSSENKPNDNTETYISIGDSLLKFDFWYTQNDITYSTIKVTKSEAIYWTVGIDALEYDNIEIDYELKHVWLYNDKKIGTLLYSMVVITSIVGVGFVIFFFCLEKEERVRYRKEK